MTERVVIVGAGAVGCLSALALAGQGRRVTLVDRGALGAESSWAGGGILFPLLPWKYAEAVNRLALAGAAAYPELCAALHRDTGIDPEYRRSGMLVAACPGNANGLTWCREHGVDAEMRGEDLWLPGVGQARNPRLMQALRLRLLQAGVELHEQTELLPLDAGLKALTSWRSSDGRSFEADAFVVTAGAWSAQLLGAHAPATEIKPMRGQMLLFRLPPETLPCIVYQDDFYLIPRRDGHLLAGSTVEDVGFDKSTTSEAETNLRERAARLLPALATAPLLKHWSGLRPGSPDNIPVIDRHPVITNLFLNSGHFRYGVTMAPASAELLLAVMGIAGTAIAARDYAFPT